MIVFHKYQGTGNDFVIIDDRNETFDFENENLINKICDRKLGVGADGLILLRNSKDSDFKMIYYNADGKESTMCGNGGRCIAHFAREKGIISKNAEFDAIDGVHLISLVPGSDIVSLAMSNVNNIESIEMDGFLNTGSPHYVRFVNDLSSVEIIRDAHEIRFSPRFKSEGVNINFVELIDDGIYVRTYERGVEDETLSCGTGMVAAVLYASKLDKIKDQKCKVSSLGGKVTVHFTKEDSNTFSNIWLQGPAKFVFKGEIHE